jgi:hypothetical protein
LAFAGRCDASSTDERSDVKRLLLALFVGGAVFGTVYGLAASLGVTTKTLGSGSSVVAGCQVTTLTTSYATAYDATLPGYKVGVVTINGLDTTSATNCASKSFKVTLTGASNASLGEITGTTPASGTSFSADFTSSVPTVSAANVTGVHVLITG